jgi:hypothetical protein
VVKDIDEALTSHDAAFTLIAATTTGAGLTRSRRTGAGISSGHEDPLGELKALVTRHLLTPHQWHREWEYTISGTGTPD